MIPEVFITKHGFKFKFVRGIDPKWYGTKCLDLDCLTGCRLTEVFLNDENMREALSVTLERGLMAFLKRANDNAPSYIKAKAKESLEILEVAYPL